MARKGFIVAITSGGPHAWIMINALREQFGDFPVIVEDGEPSDEFWRRRRKLLGPMKVASMQAARLPIKVTKRGTDTVIREMIETQGLQPDPPSDLPLIHVPSVNSDAARDALKDLDPAAVFVVSTRMIGKRTLNFVAAPFINYHSGINPAYRGMYGGYFALANGAPEHFGATVHLVDEGVDTGDTLYQSRLEADPRDNFHTYLWRLAAGSRDIVIAAMEDALNGTLSPSSVDLPSKQYFAPTLGGYLWTGVSKGVW
ncbi:MAG: formyl transferase [Pseudomonadota bacterium]